VLKNRTGTASLSAPDDLRAMQHDIFAVSVGKAQKWAVMLLFSTSLAAPLCRNSL
jgi:hypothetical protein